MKTALYHVSAWSQLATARPGDEFTLLPGPQGAEGPGVYFAEGGPSFAAADGARYAPVAAVVMLEAEAAGWWQSKAAKSRKFGKPRTWHSAGKALACRVLDVLPGAVPTVRCAWGWKA